MLEYIAELTQLLYSSYKKFKKQQNLKDKFEKE